jgi:hypothetical protein
MDAFKLAVETIIVGLLAVPWLAAAIDLLFPTPYLTNRVSTAFGQDKAQTALGVGETSRIRTIQASKVRAKTTQRTRIGVSTLLRQFS